MSPLDSILSSILDLIHEKRMREAGTQFEKVSLHFLKHDHLYRDRFLDVFTYTQWAQIFPHAAPTPNDTGIDLVAFLKPEFHEGDARFVAIQCKFYAENRKLRKSDGIDSFIAASNSKYFKERLLFRTCDLSFEAEQMIRYADPPVASVTLQNLRDSDIDWGAWLPDANTVTLKPKFSPRPYQQEAIDAVVRGFHHADRGKLIMACGTGKTFTALRTTETLADEFFAQHPEQHTFFVGFFVPSLALLGQTLAAWSSQTNYPLYSFVVCSDQQIGRSCDKNDDLFLIEHPYDLQIPATTDANRLAEALHRVFNRREKNNITDLNGENIAPNASQNDQNHTSNQKQAIIVVFSTYHSLAILGQAQNQFNIPSLNLAVCDEAHRTTGHTFNDQDDSTFVKVHDQQYLKAEKRLYMTATPRIYKE